MPRHNKKAPEKKSTPSAVLSFQLSWAGLAGLAVVLFFLFLWMFLLGIWAGQTLLVSTTERDLVAQGSSEAVLHEDWVNENLAVEVLLPRERKRRISPQELPILHAE